MRGWALALGFVCLGCTETPQASDGVVVGTTSTGVADSSSTTGTEGSSGGLESSSSASSSGGSSSESTAGSSSSGAETSTGPAVEPPSARHRPVPIGTDGAPEGYWEYLPLGYAEGNDPPPPLLIFLHGLGANGDGDADLDDLLETAIPRMIENDDWPDDRPFVVLSPQYGGELCIGPGDIQTFIAWAVQQYAIDPSRVYLTAISCGAYGGWRYLAQVPDTQIAASVLIAGDGRQPFDAAGCDLARVPIWAFHGDADGVVPVEGTTVPVEGLLACEPQPDVELTIYRGVGHNSWSRTYDGSAGHDVFAWMLEHVATD